MTEIETEQAALERMRRGDEEGLAWFIRRYTAYVSAIVWNLAGHAITAQDAEEITADIFLSLWRYCGQPGDGKVKSYLAAVARSRAFDRLKSLGRTTALEYDELELTCEGPEGAILEREARQAVRGLVDAMELPDREIFIRHYYYGESCQAVAAATGLTAANVRKRLERGRETLRRALMKGEDEHDA